MAGGRSNLSSAWLSDGDC